MVKASLAFSEISGLWLKRRHTTSVGRISALLLCLTQIEHIYRQPRSERFSNRTNGLRVWIKLVVPIHEESLPNGWLSFAHLPYHPSHTYLFILLSLRLRSTVLHIFFLVLEWEDNHLRRLCHSSKAILHKSWWL